MSLNGNLHAIISRSRASIFLDYLLDLPCKAAFRSAAIVTVLLMFSHKLNINYSLWESLLLGTCVGLIV
jgi:hypothetical protein